MWKLPALFLLALFSQLALALPAPKDIEAAVRARQYAQAESMLREVLQAKPKSAKAYYELGQVLLFEGRPGDARQALEQAQGLEPDLKFARSPDHFRALLNRAERGAVAPIMAGVPAAPSGTAFPWPYVLIGGGLLIGLWALMRRVGQSSGAGAPVPAGYGGAGSYGGSPGYGPVPGPAPGGGIGGAVLGGLAGMAAGYGLAKVLEHDSGATSAPAVTPVDPQPPQAADYGDFDAGTGDGWDDPDLSTGGDDW